MDGWMDNFVLFYHYLSCLAPRQNSKAMMMYGGMRLWKIVRYYHEIPPRKLLNISVNICYSRLRLECISVLIHTDCTVSQCENESHVSLNTCTNIK
jgi:hypothetical protein